MPDCQIISGIISKEGKRLEGRGFSSRRKEKGEYEIRFDDKFDRDPAVVASAEHAEESDRKVLNVVIDKETAGNRKREAVILIQTPDGDPNDNRFHFIAVAVR